MHKEMRRKDKQLSEKETIEIVNSGEYGILATIDAHSRPYAVPLNYAFHNGKIYFHCAVSGHKTDNIDHSPNVSFCIVDNADVIADKFSTNYKSVIISGKVEEVFSEEKEEGLTAIIHRFSGEHLEAGKKYIRNAWDKTRVYKIEIEHMTGKGTK